MIQYRVGFIFTHLVKQKFSLWNIWTSSTVYAANELCIENSSYDRMSFYIKKNVTEQETITDARTILVQHSFLLSHIHYNEMLLV